MALSNEMSCRLIRAVTNETIDNITNLKRLAAKVEGVCNKGSTCDSTPRKRRQVRHSQIIEEIIATQIKLMEEVESHERVQINRSPSESQNDTDQTKLKEVVLTLTDPCEISIDLLVEMRRNLETKLADLKYHNGIGEDCDMMRKGVVLGELRTLTKEFIKNLKKLHQWINKHNSRCPNSLALLETIKPEDDDSGYHPEEEGHHTNRFGYCVQEVGDAGQKQDDETSVKLRDDQLLSDEDV